MTKTELLASVRQYGAEQEARDALASDPNPPKLRAAVAMAAAAEAGEITMADLPELTKAYFQGNSPSSLPQQQAKFGAFIKAGRGGYATKTMDALTTIVRGTNDAKQAKKAVSGIFEKAVNAMREALKVEHVPPETVLRGVLFGNGDAKDAELEAIKRAISALNAANENSNANFATLITTLEAHAKRREGELARGEATQARDAQSRQTAEVRQLRESVERASQPVPQSASNDLADHLMAG